MKRPQRGDTPKAAPVPAAASDLAQERPMTIDDGARWTPPAASAPPPLADRTGYLLFFLGRFGVGAVNAAVHFAAWDGYGARPLESLTLGLGFLQSALVWAGLLGVAVGLDPGHGGAAVMVILTSIGTSAVFQSTGMPAEIPVMAPTLIAFAAPTVVFGLALGASGRRAAMWAALTLATVGLLTQRATWFAALRLTQLQAEGELVFLTDDIKAGLLLTPITFALEIALWFGVAWLNPRPATPEVER
jgi:hypothetical protein